MRNSLTLNICTFINTDARGIIVTKIKRKITRIDLLRFLKSIDSLLLSKFSIWHIKNFIIYFFSYLHNISYRSAKEDLWRNK